MLPLPFRALFWLVYNRWLYFSSTSIVIFGLSGVLLPAALRPRSYCSHRVIFISRCTADRKKFVFLGFFSTKISFFVNSSVICQINTSISLLPSFHCLVLIYVYGVQRYIITGHFVCRPIVSFVRKAAFVFNFSPFVYVYLANLIKLTCIYHLQYLFAIA